MQFTDDYENATLRETDESRNRRGKVEPQHGREKQAELFNAAMQGSDRNGEREAELDEEEAEGEDEEMAGLVRVLTKDSENSDKRGGEAPARDRTGESAVRERQGQRRRRRSSAGVTAVAA